MPHSPDPQAAADAAIAPDAGAPQPLPEIAERNAAGEVAEIYADIRATLGVPLVNLIYRHLATDPAVLRWTWTSVRPHLVSGALVAQAGALRDAVARDVAGWDLQLGAPLPQAAADLVGSYNTGNSLNLVALTHLLRAGTQPAVQAAASQTLPAPAGDSPPEPALPPIPALGDLSADELARVHRLNRFGEPGAPEIVASLYRHLAVWPGALQGVEAALAPLQQRGLLSAARHTAAATASLLAQRQPLPMPPQPAAFADGFATRVAGFATVTIPKMVPIGIALERALRRSAAAG